MKPRATKEQMIREAIREHMHRLATERGQKGGTARAKNMSAAKRSASARKAARARWKKDR